MCFNSHLSSLYEGTFLMTDKIDSKYLKVKINLLLGVFQILFQGIQGLALIDSNDKPTESPLSFEDEEFGAFSVKAFISPHFKTWINSGLNFHRKNTTCNFFDFFFF